MVAFYRRSYGHNGNRLERQDRKTEGACLDCGAPIKLRGFGNDRLRCDKHRKERIRQIVLEYRERHRGDDSTRPPRKPVARVTATCSKGCGRTVDTTAASASRATCAVCTRKRKNADGRRAVERKKQAEEATRTYQEALAKAMAHAAATPGASVRLCEDCPAIIVSDRSNQLQKVCPTCRKERNRAAAKRSRDRDREGKGPTAQVYGTCKGCGSRFRAKAIDGKPSKSKCVVCEAAAIPEGTVGRGRKLKEAAETAASRLVSQSPPPRGSCYVCGDACPGWYCSSTHRRKAVEMLMVGVEREMAVAEVMEMSNGPDVVFDPEAGGARGKGVYRPLNRNGGSRANGVVTAGILIGSTGLLLMAVADYVKRRRAAA